MGNGEKNDQILEIKGVKYMNIDRDEFEFYDEWENRDAELDNMSLEDFDEARRIEEYGWDDVESGESDSDEW